MENNGFYQFKLPLSDDLFEPLSNSIDFEDITTGRKGNHLVKVNDAGIPLVRTTTRYSQPAHNFSTIHNKIVGSIQHVASDVASDQSQLLAFNNALIEIYDRDYVKMKYHSDQSMDSEAESFIALFSCYEDPTKCTKQALRKLKIKDKTSNEESEFLLENNSVILFSLSTNTKFQHKIVLETVKGMKPTEFDNRWLGITFRKSSTMLKFKNDLPCMPNGEILTLADETQKREFYSLRGQENRSMNFVYPEINYTLSAADIMKPKDP